MTNQKLPSGTVVECRTRDPEVPSSNPGVGKKKISHRSNQNNTTTNPSAPDFNTWNCQRWKPDVTHVTVVECRTRDPEVPQLQTLVWAKQKISHWPNQNNTTTNPYAPELNTWNIQMWKAEVTLAQWLSSGLEIKRSPVQTLVWAKRKSFTGLIRTIPSPIPLHQSSIPEIVRGENQKSPCHPVVECRTRDPEVPSSNPGVGKKKISHRSNQNNTTSNPSVAPECRTKYLQTLVWGKRKLSEVSKQYKPILEVKTRNHWGTVVECRTRDPEVPSSNPGVGKNKNSHRSNQNNTTTNPSAPNFNTKIFRGKNQKSPCDTVVECRTRDPEVPSSNPGVWAKRKSLTGPIRTIPPPIPLHQSFNTCNYQMWKPDSYPCHSGRVQD